ncbi:cytochrome P450 [Mycena galericulata]|nr:cytochrome P450 [Mycena galericulata]
MAGQESNLTQFNDPDDSAFQAELEQNYTKVVKLHGLLGVAQDQQLFVFDSAALNSILVQDQHSYEGMEDLIIVQTVDIKDGKIYIVNLRLTAHRCKPFNRSLNEPPLQTVLDRFLLGKGIFSSARDGHRKYRKTTVIPAFSTANLRPMIPLFYEVAEKTRDGLIAPYVGQAPQMLIGRPGISYSFDPMLPGQEESDRYAQALRAMINELRALPKRMNTNTHREHYQTAKYERQPVPNKWNASYRRGIGGMHLVLVFRANTTMCKRNYASKFFRFPSTLITTHRVLALPFLDGVVREILRLYPPASPVMFREYIGIRALTALVISQSTRRALVDTVLPLTEPITSVDGGVMHSITVPKGTSIYLAIAAANHDKEIWEEDALEFKPERWTNGKANSVTTKLCGVYGNTMTFLGGGRSCIGFKYAQLEISALIDDFDIWIKPQLHFVFSEVVLCVPLRSFKFSAPDPRIEWQKPGAILGPYLDNQPALPILVEQRKPY